MMEESTLKETDLVSKGGHQKHKRIATIESDSEEDLWKPNTEVTDTEHSGEQSSNVSIVKGGARRIFDSDSEEDTNNANTHNEISKFSEKKQKAFLDSDSEDEVKSPKPANTDDDFSESEHVITPHNKSFSQVLQPNNVTEPVVYSSNRKGEVITEDIIKQQKSRLSALCDSESSEDEEATNHISSNSYEEIDQENNIQPVPYKKKQSKKSAEPKPKKMTAKQAAQQRQEIRSESLKMLRDSNIALPYHKPKSYTLKEFLQKRSSFSSALSIDSKTPPAVAIKMSRQQLEVISKKLKEREKEVKEFFKSDSESDGEEENATEIPAENQDVESKEDPAEEGKSPDQMENSLLLAEAKGSIEKENNDSDKLDNVDTSSSKVIILQNVVLNSEQVNTEADIEYMDNSAKSHNQLEDSENVMELALTETNHNVADIEATEQYEYQGETELNENNALQRSNSNENSEILNPQVPQHRNDHSSDQYYHENTIIQTSKECRTPDPNTNEEVTEGLSSSNDNTELIIDNDKMDVDPPLITDQQTLENNHRSDMDYTFNLDDVEDEPNSSKELPTGADVSKNNSKDQLYSLNSFNEVELSNEKETSNARGQIISGNDVSESKDQILDGQKPSTVKKVSRLQMLREKLGNTQPKLSGGPDEVIDLEKGITRPNEISQLMQRFMKHTARKAAPKQVHLSIVSVTGGEIHKETVNMNIDKDDEPVAVMEKPGAKLQKLRVELQMQMAQKRAELWQKKKAHLQPETTKNIDEDEPDKGEAEDDILDDEEEAELTDDSVEEEEEYDEVDECELVDEPRKKSAFVNEEAEESDEDHEDNDDIEQTTAAAEDEEVADDETESKEEVISEEVEQEGPRNKILKRIIKPFADDTDDESSSDSLDSNPPNETFKLRQEDKLSLMANSENDEITSCQKPLPDTPQRTESAAESKTDLGFFLTPVTYLTGLQNLNSGSKYLRDSPRIVSPFQIQNMPSQSHENNHSLLQKKLFQDSSDNSDTQQSLEDMPKQNLDTSTTEEFEGDPSTQELLGVCSGAFTGISQFADQNNDVTFPDKDESSQPSTQDLLAVCSGGFTGKVGDGDTQKKDLAEDIERSAREDDVSTQDLLDVCSGSFTGVSKALVTHKTATEADGSATQIHLDTQNEEMKELDEDQDHLISQLLDEDELEQFKKKFVSPPKKPGKAKLNLDGDEVVGSGAIIDSDDESESLEVKKKKKKQKKLTFSDDESSEEENVGEEEEEIALHDDVDSDAGDEPADNIEYDSEENEIDVNSDALKVLKPSDFFENEAELSESDWDSEDEDEKNLDNMEFELADNEKFDEEKVKSDLEKIHMRRILDDDAHEVKLLQEILLEDGEMHGTGRQRQFRWKHLDSVGEDNTEKKDEDLDVYFEEEESEEQWRKMRYQREMFLKEKRESQTLEEDEDVVSGDSQILSFGKRVFVRSQSKCSSQNNTSVEKANVRPTSPEVKQPLTLLNKRGSFLSRNDQVLNRLAEINKVENVQQGGASKKAKNFVFHTVSVKDETKTEFQTQKRKADNATPNVIKKLRITNLTPSATKKKFDMSSKAKQLFNF